MLTRPKAAPYLNSSSVGNRVESTRPARSKIPGNFLCNFGQCSTVRHIKLNASTGWLTFFSLLTKEFLDITVVREKRFTLYRDVFKLKIQAKLELKIKLSKFLFKPEMLEHTPSKLYLLGKIRK